VLRLLLSLLFAASTNSPLYLHRTIKDCELWNSDDLWEAIMFEGTYEEILLLPGSRRSELREIHLMQQKNIVFSSLTTYCHYMAMLGNPLPTQVASRPKSRNS
jgi:lipid A disaccharide synthetase